MTEYAVLIYDDEQAYANLSEQALREVHEAHGGFVKQVGELGGEIRAGRALRPSGTATTIRDDLVTDGPFAETKEVLAGFYIIDASDLDQALAIGRLCPVVNGSIEVRPVMPT